MNFRELLKNEEILKSIEEKGYKAPTKIQEGIIPLILNGNDVLGQSQTGTGKTLAYAAPILSNIESNGVTQSLILAPTRELAMQISKEIELTGKYTNINVTSVYGSSRIETQINILKRGCEIVVGTPGRVKDLIKRSALKLKNVKYFVLDEADEMLSMGFQEDIEFIFGKVNKEKQTLLFSATMPKTILTIAKKYMNKEYKTVVVESKQETADNIEQYYYVVNDKTRAEAMCRVMDYYNPSRAMIFTRTKRNADELLEKLTDKGYSVNLIHGDVMQSQRIQTLEQFKSGQFNYLIATDVAARGIHVNDVEIVFNYNLPESNEAYVHRIGRTGRADKSGIAITLVKDKEKSILKSIEHHVKSTIVEKQLPTKEEIIDNRVNNVIDMVNNIKIDKENEKVNEYIESLKKDELVNITKKLVNKYLYNGIGSDFNTDITVTKSKKKRNTNDDTSVRVFCTIGKMDGIEKREFLSFIEDKAKVPVNTCTGVEIMTKFTFMNVRREYLNKVLEKCNNVKYKNRVMKIERAKK